MILLNLFSHHSFSLRSWMRNAFSRSVIAFEQNNSFELAYPFEADIRYVVKSVIINRLLLNKDFLIIIFFYL